MKNIIKKIKLDELIIIKGRIYKLQPRAGSNGKIKWEKVYLNLLGDEEDFESILSEEINSS